MERSSRVVLNQRVQPIPKRVRAASGESSVVGEGLAEVHSEFPGSLSSDFKQFQAISSELKSQSRTT